MIVGRDSIDTWRCTLSNIAEQTWSFDASSAFEVAVGTGAHWKEFE
jgi:hypothetical protein